jgi:hypothetical protein
MTEQLRIDNSKRSSFVECPRKFFWKFERNLTGEYGSTALRYGRTWHVMLHAFYDTIQKHGWQAREQALTNALMHGKKEWDSLTLEQIFYDDFRTFENLCELIMGYVVTYEHEEQNAQVIHTEQVFAVPMVLTPAEQILYPELQEVIFTGKIDLQIELSGMKWVWDHKTTGNSIERVGTTLKRDPQFLGYTYASRKVLDFIPVGFMVNMTMSSSRKNKDGVYGKLTTDFRRLPQLYSEGDLESWRSGFIHTCSRIAWCYQHDMWPMQHDACYNFGKECTYTRLCEQNRPIPDTRTEGYLEIPWDVEKEAGLSDAD